MHRTQYFLVQCEHGSQFTALFPTKWPQDCLHSQHISNRRQRQEDLWELEGWLAWCMQQETLSQTRWKVKTDP